MRKETTKKIKVISCGGRNYVLAEKYDNVINIAEELLNDKYADKDNKSIVLIYLINIYTERKEYLKAYNCIKQAEDQTGLKNKPYLFESVAKLYKATGNYRHALNYMDSVIVYNDSITTVTNRQLTENSKIKIEIMKFKADMDKQLARMQQRHYTLILT